MLEILLRQIILAIVTNQKESIMQFRVYFLTYRIPIGTSMYGWSLKNNRVLRQNLLHKLIGWKWLCKLIFMNAWIIRDWMSFFFMCKKG